MHNILIYLKGEFIGYVVLRVCSFLLDSRLRGNDGMGSGNDDIGSGNDGIGSGNDGIGSGNDCIGSGNDGIGSGNDGIGSGNDGNGCFVYLNVWHTDLRTLLDYKAYWIRAACC